MMGFVQPTLKGHFEIARVDHWVKNAFVLPGMVIAVAFLRDHALNRQPWTAVAGLVSVCLIASSNYVLNELLDAPFDVHHPTKRNRPVPSGRVSIPLAYLQWLVLFLGGVALAWQVSLPFTITMAALWCMGCIYNSKPVRTKDVAYLDVLTESINNPLRLLAGWYLTGNAAVPPISLVISYWMVGCYFMAIKRFAEYREIGNIAVSAAYRKSFRHYSERTLLVSIVFYASQAMLFFGAFVMRYRLELIFSFPLIAIVMSYYLLLAFDPNSAVQRPEALYREHFLMVTVTTCSLVMGALLFVDIPLVHKVFAPTMPVR